MANIKITELPESSSITSNDLLLMVDSGNPYVTKKITWKDIDAPQDSVTYGRRNGSWVDLYGNANLQFTQGSSSEVANYTPLSGEPVYDTTNKVVHIGDGTKAGGNLIGTPSKYLSPNTPYQLPLSGPYVTPISLTLGPSGSVWKVTTSMSLESVDDANSTTFNFYPTISGISYKYFSYIYSINSDNVKFGDILAANDVTINTLSAGDKYSLQVDHIITVTLNSGIFGIQCKEDSSFDSYIQYRNIIAQRLA